MPLNAPYRLTAWTAYSEQVGIYRQLGGKSGEIPYWYPLISNRQNLPPSPGAVCAEPVSGVSADIFRQLLHISSAPEIQLIPTLRHELRAYRPGKIQDVP